MRHRKSGVKLNRTTSHRQAMFRNMVTSLFKHDRIKTTDAKAKELRRWADHMVTLAKRGDLHARRLALSIMREKDVVHKLFEEAQERFGSRKGGYTRIVKIGRRAGDTAAMTLVELVQPDEAKPAKEKKAKTKPAVQKEEVAVQAESIPAETAEAETGEAALPEEEVTAAPGPDEAVVETAEEATDVDTAEVDEEGKKDPEASETEK